MFGKIVSTSVKMYKGTKQAVKRVREGGGEAMQGIYDFHESGNPWRFYRNHSDLIASLVGQLVSRCILIPYAGWEKCAEGSPDHTKIIAVMVVTTEAVSLLLFSTYFSPMKKVELLQLFSWKWLRVGMKLGTWCLKWNILGLSYLCKLAKNFPDSCPKTYLFATDTSLLIQNVLRSIG